MSDPMELMSGSGGQPIPKDFNAEDAQNLEDVRPHMRARAQSQLLS